jgi:hypothetical protein
MIATNYNAYLARYPRGYLDASQQSGCDSVGSFLARSQGVFRPERSLLIMRDQDQANCPHTGRAVRVLPLDAAPPTSVFRLVSRE